MHRVLEDILSQTRKDLEARKAILPLDKLKESAAISRVSFFESAMQAPRNGSVALIAEIKLASPSEANLGSEQDIESRAKAYEEGGADAISFVTEKHFFKG